MKAISLWQPWATAMALGVKRIETRSWATSYRGLLAIHAAKRWTREEREFLQEMKEDDHFPRTHFGMPLGAIVAVGRLIEIKRTEQLVPSIVRSNISEMEEAWGNYEPRRYGWIFEDIQPLPEPIPFRGAQGFFDVPDEVFDPSYRPPPPPEPTPAPPPRQGQLVL